MLISISTYCILYVNMHRPETLIRQNINAAVAAAAAEAAVLMY